MNLTELTKNLQANSENKADAKRKKTLDLWAKVKEYHPVEAKFIGLINETFGRPTAIKITSGNDLIYGAGKFSPEKNMKVVLSGDYSWMDKPRTLKIFAKKDYSRQN